MVSGRHIDKVTVIVLACAIFVTVLFMNGEALGMEKIVDEDTESYTGTEHFTKNDLDGTWDDGDATQIILEGDAAKIIGTGAYELDGSVYITTGGYYTVSGVLTDGSLIVDAYQSSKVWIMLDGAQISCSDDAALRVDQADKVFLTLKEGTQSTLSSGADYSAEAIEDGTGGTIYAHDDLTINGSGTLGIVAEYKHGIECNDSLTVTGGIISITAPQDGIQVNDDFNFTGARLTMEVGDDAIHSDTAINIDGGIILISDCYEGLESPQINVTDGEITIWPEDDGFNANGGSEMELSSIKISGGTITIINETGRDADGLDSNGNIYISGGTIRISLTNSGSNCAIDYGSESGGVCVISGGEVIACGSSSMTEGFDQESTQCAVLYNFSAGAEEGTTFAIKDENGNTLLSWEVPCSYSSVNVSSPLLEVGKTYQVVTGDDVEEITPENISATYGDAASSAVSMDMHQNGMHKRESFARNQGDMTKMPNPPEGSEPGEMPEPPTLPAGMEAGMRPEEMNGGEAQQVQRPVHEMENGVMQPADTSHEPASDAASQNPETVSLSPEALAELAAAAVVLAAGILIAMRFRRKR